MMHSNENVVWHEGLLMAPQHMQAQSRYHDLQLHSRLVAQCGHVWGVVSLVFDDAALTADTIAITSGQIVMPSGLVLTFGPQTGMQPLMRSLDAPTSQRGLSAMAADGSRSLDVYLGVARDREGLQNVATSDLAQSHQRYTGRPRVMAEHTFGQTPPVEVLVRLPHAQLIFGHERTEDVETIHITRLVRTPDGRWARCPTFTPPCLRLHQHATAVARLRQIVGKLRRAADGLAPLGEMVRRTHDGQMAPRWSDIEGLMQLRALQTIVSQLEHIVEDTDLTSREGYVLLKQTIAAGAPLLSDTIPQVVAYKHAEQAVWMADCLAHLERMTPSLRVDVTRMPAAQSPNGYLEVDLERCVALGHKAYVMLEIDASQGHRQTVDLWLAQAKVAAVQNLEHLMRTASSGIGLTEMVVLPDGMHARPGHAYLALDVSHAGWGDAHAAGSLGIAPPEGAHSAQSTCLLLAQVRHAKDAA